MFEVHPFKPFIPPNAKYLLLGSFPGRQLSRAGEWYYETERGQFWPILRQLYSLPLSSREEKIKLMNNLRLSLSDTIYKCERVSGNNSDSNLKVIEYNLKIVGKILSSNNIEKIFFSSRFVEKIFKSKFKALIKKYPRIELVTLPSTSPRYASLSISAKLEKFKALMPPLNIP
jgi:hypoxanthine-DNA glycosylase